MSVCRFGGNGERVAVTLADGKLAVWKKNGIEEHSPCPSSSQLSLTCLAWCPASSASSSQPQSPKKKSTEERRSMADLVALGTASGTALLYSLAKRDTVTQFKAAEVGLNCILWTNSCKSLILGAEDGMVSIFSVMTLELLARFKIGAPGVGALAITPDDKYIISGSRELNVWEVRKQALVKTFTGHADQVTSLSCIGGKDSYFILSTSQTDKHVSVWEFSPAAKPKRKPESVNCTLAVNETILQQESLKIGEDDELLTSVTTSQGSVLLYQYSVKKKTSKQIKPSKSLKVTDQDKENSKDSRLQIQACSLKNSEAPVITLAYGSETQLQLESLSYSDLEGEETILERDLKSSEKGCANSNQTSPKKSKTPSKKNAPEDETKDMETKTPNKGVKRKKEPAPPCDPSLEDRLSLINSKSSLDKLVQQPEALSQMLIQGLRSEDQSVLSSVLEKEEEEIVGKAVARLPIQYVKPLLLHLKTKIETEPGMNLGWVRWARLVVRHHATYIATSHSIREGILSPMIEVMKPRHKNHLQISRLSGKMKMILEQRKRNLEGQANNEVEDISSLLVFQEPSDNESDDEADNDEGVGSEDDMGDYLSNLEIDEDQEEDRADEDDDDVIGPDSQMTNGDKESDDSMDET